MAFTLGFHIVLASLGVAFPAMMLIANYRGLRQERPRCAAGSRERWSKVAAVTFAVGAVTGTVLSFEFGLLWPEFTGRFGQVFGVLFAIEGIFFFLEAIFIAIYIFGWKRLSGMGALLDRGADRDRRARRRVLGRRRQLLDEPAAGIHARVRRRRHRRRPVQGDLQPGGPATRCPHMILAAYLVTGFLIASVYAVGMLRGRRDRHHRLGLLIPLTVAAIATPIQFAVGRHAPPVRSPTTSRSSSPRWSACRRPTTDVTEYIGGRCTSDGIKGGIGIPGLDSFLVGLSTDTKVTGLDTRAGRRSAAREHDAALGLRHDGRDLHGADRARTVARTCAGGAGGTSRRRAGSCGPIAVSGIAAIVALECGWIVTEVGRQPWIVYKVMRTEDAVTGRQRRLDHAGGDRAPRTSLLGIATVVVLRAMSRRWREADVPDDRRALRAATERSPPRRWSRVEQGGRGRRGALGRSDPLRGVRRRRLRRRLLGAARRRRRARRAGRELDRLGDRTGLGVESRLADLRAGRAVDGVLGRLRVDHVDPVHPARAWPLSASC